MQLVIDQLGVVKAQCLVDPIFLVEVEALAERSGIQVQIGFTGGEPFMNPEFLPMLRDCLDGPWHVLVLTNAMKPIDAETLRFMPRSHNAARCANPADDVQRCSTSAATVDACSGNQKSEPSGFMSACPLEGRAA